MSDPKFDFGFSMTLFQQNIHELPDMVRLVAELGGNILRTCFGVVFKRDNFHLSVVNCPDVYNQIYMDAQESANQYGVNLSMPSPFIEHVRSEEIEKGFCDFLYTGIRITHDGKVTACLGNTPLVLDYEGKHIRLCCNNKGMKTLRVFHDTDRAHPSCRDCYVVNRGKNTLENREKQLLQYRSEIV